MYFLKPKSFEVLQNLSNLSMGSYKIIIRFPMFSRIMMRVNIFNNLVVHYHSIVFLTQMFIYLLRFNELT